MNTTANAGTERRALRDAASAHPWPMREGTPSANLPRVARVVRVHGAPRVWPDEGGA